MESKPTPPPKTKNKADEKTEEKTRLTDMGNKLRAADRVTEAEGLRSTDGQLLRVQHKEHSQRHCGHCLWSQVGTGLIGGPSLKYKNV